MKKYYLTKGDVEFLKRDGEVYIDKDKKIIYIDTIKKVS